jgi:hypothetical protein
MHARVTAPIGALLVILTLASPQTADAHDQLRGMQATSRRLISDGLLRSPTIRRLAETIEASDLIVYVDLRRGMASHVVGAMRYVASTTTHRVVRVNLNADYPWPTLLAYLGHELQHACELAAASSVNSSDRLRAHYRLVGIRVDRDAYDTREAQAITRRVQSELRARRPRRSGWR